MAGSQKRSKTKNKKRKAKQNPPPASFLECNSLTCVTGILPTVASSSAGSSVSTNTKISAPVPHLSVVSTPAASDISKELFLERFVREIVQPFSLRSQSPMYTCKRRYHEKTLPYTQSLLNKRQKKDDQNETNAEDSQLERQRRHHCRQRLIMGTNQCARYLEQVASSTKQQLVDQGRPKGELGNKPKTQAGISSDAKALVPSLMVLARDIYPPIMLSQAPLWARALNIPILLLPGQASSELGQAVGTRKTSILLFLPRSESSETVPPPETVNSKYRDDDEIDSFVEYVKTLLQGHSMG